VNINPPKVIIPVDVEGYFSSCFGQLNKSRNLNNLKKVFLTSILTPLLEI